MIGLWPNVRALPEILPFGPDTILPLAGSIDVLPPKKVDGFSVIVMPFTVTWVIFLNTVNSSQSTIKVHRGLAVGVDVMGDLLGLTVVGVAVVGDLLGLAVVGVAVVGDSLGAAVVGK